MAHEIEIEIRPDGTLAFGVKGVRGRKCRELTKFLEELGDTLSSETTSEYYQEDAVETADSAAGHVRVEKR